MTAPSVQFIKAQFGTGVAPPSAVGILAILAASATGAANVASSFARDDLAFAAFGAGPLVEYASYDIQMSGNPAVLVKTTASIASTYTAVTKTMTGTSVPTAGATAPLDEYNPAITIVTGGTVGVSGITYTYSLDGGDAVSGVTALGTANTLTIPGTGVSFALAAGTLVAGDVWSCFTTRPQGNNTDLAAALEALRITRLPYEGILLDTQYATGTVGLVDTWLAGLEATGSFHYALLNTRHKTQPVPTAESETTFAASVSAQVANDTSTRICVGADAADYTSTMTGITQPRPVAMFLGARASSIAIGEEPAFVGRGPIQNASITDGGGNPRWHDEDLYPTLGSQRLVALRSFSDPGPQGVYISQSLVLSASGSDYVVLPHVRVMNAACGIVWSVLVTQLNIGVAAQAANAQGQVYIQPRDAQRLDALCNDALVQPMRGQCSAIQYATSRTDNIASNAAATLTGTVSIVSLKYVGKFVITTSYVKSIAVPVSAAA